MAQPTMLAALLDNLLDNACKYGEAGSPIVVRPGVTGEHATIRVEDRGVGIPPGDLPRIFDPFFRSDQVRRDGAVGTGLGLSIALRLAESLGGTIDATSNRHEGSVFTVSLPLAAGRPEVSRDVDAQ